MPETPEQRRERLTKTSQKAAVVRSAAAVSRYLAKVPTELMVDELAKRKFVVFHEDAL